MERSTHTLAVKSQQWLVEAMLALIGKKPYDEISISELCKEASLDRRTFYRNFKDKNDVMFFYFSHLLEEYLLALKGMPQRNFYSLAKVYFEFWTCHLNFFKTSQKNQALSAILFQALNTSIPAVYAEAGGSVSKELRYNIAFVIGGFHNVLIQCIADGFQETAEEMAAIVSSMFKDSVSYWPELEN